jgi:hypothetical protein
MAITRGSERDLLRPGLAGIIMAYPEIPRQWPQIFDRRSSKMALERFVEMKPVGLAQLKQEGGATVFDNSPGERFVWNTEMTALGLGTAITREALDDNLYKDQFNPYTMGLAESFAQTWEIIHANIINQGTTYNPSVVGDGQPLFSTQHPIDTGVYANRPSPDLDLNESSVEYMLQLIRSFPDQAGIVKFFRGKRLVVPKQLEFIAERLTKTELRPNTTSNDVNATLSSGALPDGYQVMDFLTSAFAWGITTTVRGLVHFDRIPFEIDMQVDPITGNLLIIAYERQGVGFKNPRGIVFSFPTQ